MPPPGAGDLFVGRAFEPHLEFLRAVAAMDDMGVAIHQPRGDEPSFEIERVTAGELGRKRCLGTRPDDPVALDRDCAALDQPMGPIRVRSGECRVPEEHD